MKTHIVALLSAVMTGQARAETAPVTECTGNLVANPGFERGHKGWRASWAGRSWKVVMDDKRAHRGNGFLMLSATGANTGADSTPIYNELDFDAGKPQRIAASVRNLGIARGTFGLRFYVHDAAGNVLAMKSIGNLGPKSPSGGWQRVCATVGPGTDLPFPEKTDHVVIRFSFWSKDGRCEGRCLVDDVFFGPASEPVASSRRALRRGRQGAIALWKDDLPVLSAAADLGHLASLLNSAGFGVNLLTTEDLTDGALLDADRLDLLILPYGESFPAAGATVLRRFLRRGGHVITLGGRCFRKPIYRSPREWTDHPTQDADATPSRAMLSISKASVAALAPRMARGDQPAKVSLSTDSNGQPALRVVVPDLRSYKYVPFQIQGTPAHAVVCFRARGDERTEYLCVEINETDQSRWKAVVRLSSEWKRFELPAAQFASYATPGRGGRGDFLQAGRARRISFGFPASLVGGGRRSFEISQVAWRASTVDPAEMAHGSLVYEVPSQLIRAFGPQLKPPSSAGDITAFFGSDELHDVPTLKAAPGQSVFPEDLVIPGRVSGWTATVLEDNRHSLWAARASRAFLPTERRTRQVPLLITPQGKPAASLFINVGGRHAGSRWACFGITNSDIFKPGRRQTDQALCDLVHRMVRGAFLEMIEPRFSVRDDHVRMAVVADVSNGAAQKRTLHVRTRLLPMGVMAPLATHTSVAQLAPGQSRTFTVLDVDTSTFDWKRFRVECDLLQDGKRIDQLQTTLDVRTTFLAVCDRFVRTQKQRGDGKISGVGFVDNRGIRGLLAAYDLTGKKDYLDAAIAWGRATVAEQRADGGYLMGYGYYPDGNECFVADGGEIACGIARLIAYVPSDDRGGLMASLRAYMRFRESFRCEGGGIGVGWCRTDYGVRPTKPLSELRRIVAPEKNIYTIGCTLASATMYARLTKDPRDNAAAVRDAYWWMNRCKSTSGGAYVESAIWANRFLTGDGIGQATEAFLRSKLVPNVTCPDRRWWTEGGGRTVQGIDGLAYYHDCIERDPKALAALMRACYHVCSPEALSGIPRILARDRLSASEWRYLHFASVGLPNLLVSDITRKGF